MIFLEKQEKLVLNIADICLVYTILSPIILSIFGYYIEIEENFVRTVIVLQGPALISCGIYLYCFGIKSTRENYKIVLLVLFLTIVVLASSLQNWDSDFTKYGLKFILAFCFFGFLLGLAANFTERRAKNFLKYWNIIALLLIIYISISIIFFDYQIQSKFRIPGDNSARTGILFFFFSFCALINFVTVNKYIYRMICAIIFFCSAFFGLIAKSRSAISVFIVNLVFFALVQFTFFKKSKIDKFLLIALFLIFALTLSFGLFSVKGKNLRFRFLNILKTSEEAITFIIKGDSGAYKSINRLSLWQDAISKFKLNPIFGVGFGTQYFHQIKKEKRSHPHNIILQFLVETGIIGFTLFLAFILFIVNKAIHVYLKIKTEYGKQIFFFFPFAFFFFLIFACFHFAIHENYFFWYFAGMITGYDFENRPL